MRSLAKVFGGLGLLLLLTSPVTLFLSAGPIYAAVKAGVAVLLLALWFFFRDTSAQADRARGTMGSGARAAFYYSSSTAMAAVVIALLAGLNFIAARRSKTYDLTNKKIYSLAPQTAQTLKDLKEPIAAIGFLPPNHPAYDALEGLLKKYSAETDKFTYSFKDPRKAPDLAAKYQLKEGQTTVVVTRGTGPDASHTSLSVISEQELTNALIKLNTVGQQKVYWVLGHGEYPLEQVQAARPEDADMQSASELKSSLGQEGYAPETLNLVEKNEIPKDCAVLVIAGPRTPFAAGEKALLETYLAQGGRLMIFLESMVDPGLDDLLAKYGVRPEAGLVADDKVNPGNPYVVVSPFFGEHEITRFLKQLRMNVELPTARALTVLREGTLEGVSVTPVVMTSPYAWVESSPSEDPRLDSGERAGSMAVAVAVTRDTRSAQDKRFDEARLVVVGDSELLVDALWGHEANRNLVLNGLAWASTQIQKITIRPPDRDISTIDIDDATMGRIRFLAMDLLPVSLIACGLVIWLARRNK